MPETRKQRDSREKRVAYAWVAYMLTHEAAEMKRFLKYGTPSDRLIALAERRVLITSQGVAKKRTLPISLNKSSGQKLIHKIAKTVLTYVQEVPEYSYALNQRIISEFTHRRSDTRENVLMVAEAICHRAASEFKQEVLFSFDSINEWVSAAYGKKLGYVTLRRVLEMLDEQGFISVVEWGVKNNRSKATKLRLNFGKKVECGFLADDWLLMKSFAMTKVYARESVTRQNVLEERIHHYADSLVEEESEPVWPELTLRLPSKDDKLVDVTTSVVEDKIEFKEIWDDAYIDRLLGRLVQPLQEVSPSTG